MRLTLVCLALLMAAPPARADKRDVAREEFKTGARYFEIADYPNALEHFKTAYIAFEDPAILFNIAQCERLLNHKAEALRSYRIYLQKRPDSPNRADIEKIIATLQEAISKDQKRVDDAAGRRRGRQAGRRDAVDRRRRRPHRRPRLRRPKRWWPPRRRRRRRRARRSTRSGGCGPRPARVVAVAVGVGVGVGVASNSHPDFKPTGPEIGPGAASTALVAVRF